MGARRYGGAVGGLTRPPEFITLEDTPSSYAGQSGMGIAVNAGEDGLEFAAAPGGLSEGNYTTWTHKWTNDYPTGLLQAGSTSFLIDERSGVLNLAWHDGANYRFGIYNLSDFSAVFQSPALSNYTYVYPWFAEVRFFNLGNASLEDGGLSRSLQSYILLLRSDYHTIEVWRGGAGSLWSHSITGEEIGDTVFGAEISFTGKWVLVITNNKKLILYEGS